MIILFFEDAFCRNKLPITMSRQATVSNGGFSSHCTIVKQSVKGSSEIFEKEFVKR